MIKLNEIKTGDIVNARFEDVVNTGEVQQVDHTERKVLVSHGDQEFWYDTDNLSPVPFTLESLDRLGFTATDDPLIKGNGTAYVKGPFIIQFPRPGDHKAIHLIYRDEHRDVNGDIFLHQLQNHYHSMTNFHLDLV